MKPPCRHCGADTAVIARNGMATDDGRPVSVTVICTGCGEQTRSCTCPPRPTRRTTP